MSEIPTVLVVEDEESFVEALQIGLKREGFRVEVARDGAQALDMFDLVKPDLVLLDVMLPRISGIDVCRELRKKSRVPIIMVTAKGAEIDTVVGLEVGADDYVTKPYRMRELVARMRAVLAPDARRTAIGELRRGNARRSATSPSTRKQHGSGSAATRHAPAEGVRAAPPAARQRRPGAHPGDTDRPGVGQRLLR